MLVTDDEDAAIKVRRFNSLGYAGVGSEKAKITKTDIQDPGYSRHVSHGFNYRMPELCAAVALGQVERLNELVKRRMQVGALFGDAVQGCPWIKPQLTPDHCTNSYWTFAVRMLNPKITWHQCRDKFQALGGDGIYAAWKLSYLEPMFEQGCPVQHPAYTGKYQKYAPGLCPNAELVQPQLMQFKTNYWDWYEAERQSEILARTLRELDS